MRVLIYDVEIEKCVPTAGDPVDPRYKYCDGFDDYANMGIACICAYDYGEGRYRVFSKDNLDDFRQLTTEVDCVAGFNSIAFDDNLMLAHLCYPKTTYDLLCQVRIGSGQPARFTRGKTRAGYKLGAIAAANLGTSKTEDGAQAPKLWQDGKIARVIDYCLEDVRLTRKLIEIIQKTGELIDPTTGRKIAVAKLTDVWEHMQAQQPQGIIA